MGKGKRSYLRAMLLKMRLEDLLDEADRFGLGSAPLDVQEVFAARRGIFELARELAGRDVIRRFSGLSDLELNEDEFLEECLSFEAEVERRDALAREPTEDELAMIQADTRSKIRELRERGRFREELEHWLARCRRREKPLGYAPGRPDRAGGGCLDSETPGAAAPSSAVT